MIQKSPEIISEIVFLYNKISNVYQSQKEWKTLTEDDLWEGLCLCILSSNVLFELAQSATKHLAKHGLLNQDWIIKNRSSQKILAQELSKRKYLPIRKDGSLRKYRFPNIRARNIVCAARTLYRKGKGLQQYLTLCDNEQEARRILVNIPGMGLKEASHFLRNIGFSKSLAIIDRHIMNFLTKVTNLPINKWKTITPSRYYKLEKVLISMSESFNLEISMFDWAIWHYMRRRYK